MGPNPVANFFRTLCPKALGGSNLSDFCNSFLRPYLFKYLVYGFFFQNIMVGGGKKNKKKNY